MADAPEHYSTASDGGRPVCRQFTIRGRLPVADYLAFVADRAAWLSLDGWAGSDDDGVTLVACGPEALVGALEMACTLGPIAALVESITSTEFVLAVPPGFAVRQK